jgi:sec-independent protein translocase protein TatA
MLASTLLQFGIPAGPELLIILLVLVLLFGANKIPKLARSTGQAMGEFQKGRQEVEDELKQMRDSGREAVTGGAESSTETTETTETTEATVVDDEDEEREAETTEKNT